MSMGDLLIGLGIALVCIGWVGESYQKSHAPELSDPVFETQIYQEGTSNRWIIRRLVKKDNYWEVETWSAHGAELNQVEVVRRDANP